MSIQIQPKILETTKKEDNSMVLEVTDVLTTLQNSMVTITFSELQKLREDSEKIGLKKVCDLMGFNDEKVSGEFYLAKIIKCHPGNEKKPYTTVTFEIISCRTLIRDEVVYSFRFFGKRENRIYLGAHNLFCVLGINFENLSNGYIAFNPDDVMGKELIMHIRENREIVAMYSKESRPIF
jgi:hypothetical protein